MKLHAIVLLLFALPLCATRSGQACSCAGSLSPKIELARKDAVFAGRVTRIDKLGEGLLSVTLEVASVWKGIATKEVVIQTNRYEEACGFPFEVDKSYLVYAYATGEEGAKDRPLATNICTRTRLLDDRAKPEVAELGPPEKMPTP